jgi:hypothetical protein
MASLSAAEGLPDRSMVVHTSIPQKNSAPASALKHNRVNKT